MYIPSARELVEVAGRPGLFLVLWVNRATKRADLMALQNRAYAVADVPCAQLKPHIEVEELTADTDNLQPIHTR